jgi:hypothetical protein
MVGPDAGRDPDSLRADAGVSANSRVVAPPKKRFTRSKVIGCKYQATGGGRQRMGARSVKHCRACPAEYPDPKQAYEALVAPEEQYANVKALITWYIREASIQAMLDMEAPLERIAEAFDKSLRWAHNQVEKRRCREQKNETLDREFAKEAWKLHEQRKIPHITEARKTKDTTFLFTVLRKFIDRMPGIEDFAVADYIRAYAKFKNR